MYSPTDCKLTRHAKCIEEIITLSTADIPANCEHHQPLNWQDHLGHHHGSAFFFVVGGIFSYRDAKDLFTYKDGSQNFQKDVATSSVSLIGAKQVFLEKSDIDTHGSARPVSLLMALNFFDPIFMETV